MNSISDKLIKILSLGIGLAIGIVLIAKVCFELSYDSFYKDVDHIYMITESIIFQEGGDPDDFWGTSGGIAPGFKAEVPGVEAATRYSNKPLRAIPTCLTVTFMTKMTTSSRAYASVPTHAFSTFLTANFLRATRCRPCNNTMATSPSAAVLQRN